MSNVELQKQQKQFIDMHNLASDRGKMVAMPSKTSARILDEPPISEACYLMRLCEVSYKLN